MGRLVIRSADPDKGLSLKRESLEAMFPLKKGDIFDVDKIRKAIENYTKLYGVYGYHRFHGHAADRTSTMTPRPSILRSTSTSRSNSSSAASNFPGTRPRATRSFAASC